MDSKLVSYERLSFADRLISSLASAHEPITPSRFARAYNLRAGGAEVTSHAARKWLHGEAIPTQEKVHILASWLNVNPSWLRFGDEQSLDYSTIATGAKTLSTKNLVLINDIVSLPPFAQDVVRDLVNSLLRVSQEDTSGVGAQSRMAVRDRQ